MSQSIEPGSNVTFSPNLIAGDVSANYWMRQVTLRLRREIRWRWHSRSGDDARLSGLAQPGDRLVDSLDMVRYWEAKRRFLESDSTAGYLSALLDEPPPLSEVPSPRGAFGWLVETAALDEVSTFVLALGLASSFDSAVGPVISACLDDSARTKPSLELAQRLWDHPEEVLPVSDTGHPLWSLGILQQRHVGLGAPGIDWEGPFAAPPLVATRLLFPDTPPPTLFLPIIRPHGDILGGEGLKGHVARLAVPPDSKLRVVPVQGRRGSAYADTVQAVAEAAGWDVRGLDIEPSMLQDPGYLRSLLTTAWLMGVTLFLQHGSEAMDGRAGPYALLAGARSVPVTVLVGITNRQDLAGIPDELLHPPLTVPTISHAERVGWWRRWLHDEPDAQGDVVECARRFRYEKDTVRAICGGLNRLGRPPTRNEMIAACRAEVPIEMGELAREVLPRFEDHELILGEPQRQQFEEIYRAMSSLTEVHYTWGTARAWNEGGISVLFAGPPGTGKTMAAEVLALRLDLPMFRIDLSQVVDKYIGVTEKNLSRLFDVADATDLVLFFDEADALFGRRTEVRDAHDRYANLEISYLLERMERFKGLAILASNRRKDLDEAFMRRLRYVVEFPLPGVPQREAIWRAVIPEAVDASALDLAFLARQFPLAGGHIRSIVFNACLQSTGSERESDPGAHPRLSMEQVVVAVKREYDKLRRSVTLEQFGSYAPLVEGLERV